MLTPVLAWLGTGPIKDWPDTGSFKVGILEYALALRRLEEADGGIQDRKSYRRI